MKDTLSEHILYGGCGGLSDTVAVSWIKEFIKETQEIDNSFIEWLTDNFVIENENLQTFKLKTIRKEDWENKIKEFKENKDKLAGEKLTK